MEPVRGADAGAGAVLAEAEVADTRTGSDRESCTDLLPGCFGPIRGGGGVAGEAPEEGVAENVRALHPLTVAARGRLPPPEG